MAKKILSLEKQLRQAKIDELDCILDWDEKRQQFFEARLAYDAIEKFYKRSRKEWAKVRRQHVAAARTLDRLRQQLNAANQDDHAAGAKSGQSRPHGNSGE